MKLMPTEKLEEIKRQASKGVPVGRDNVIELANQVEELQIRLSNMSIANLLLIIMLGLTLASTY